MNYKKLILVGVISAFVAVLTSILGVAGTVIGSVISSVLYNMLSEALEDPVSNASIKSDFEWELAYVFPLVVIAVIQLLLIFALLAERGILPYGFLKFFISIQNLTNNNLYRLLGLALIVISAYPIVVKPDFVKKEHGLILIIVGLIFLARGFVDLNNSITNIYDRLFINFDLPIAIIAFLLISFVIYKILSLSRNQVNGIKSKPITQNNSIYQYAHQHFRHKDDDSHKNAGTHHPKKINVGKSKPKQSLHVKNKKNIQKTNSAGNKKSKHINKSSDKIRFESNDLLNEYKK